MYNFPRHVAKVARLINRVGKTITFPGNVTMKAIVDERPDQVAKAVDHHAGDLGSGRPALFHITEADYLRIPGGTGFEYDNQSWSINNVAAQTAGELVTDRILLAITGANPGETFAP